MDANSIVRKLVFVTVWTCVITGTAGIALLIAFTIMDRRDRRKLQPLRVRVPRPGYTSGDGGGWGPCTCSGDSGDCGGCGGDGGG